MKHADETNTHTNLQLRPIFIPSVDSTPLNLAKLKVYNGKLINITSVKKTSIQTPFS